MKRQLIVGLAMTFAFLAGVFFSLLSLKARPVDLFLYCVAATFCGLTHAWASRTN